LATSNDPARLFSFHFICCDGVSAIQSHIIHLVIELTPTDSAQSLLNNSILKMYLRWNAIELRQ
jgi:hypothetical protein